MVDDLHDLAGIDAGQVRQELEVEVRLVVEGGQDRDDVSRADPHLGLVVALADRSGQGRAEATLQARLERSIHLRRPSARWARSGDPASGRGGP